MAPPRPSREKRTAIKNAMKIMSSNSIVSFLFAVRINTNLKEWYGDHLWSPGCYHGSVGQGWDVVEKYISSQNRSPDKKAL